MAGSTTVGEAGDKKGRDSVRSALRAFSIIELFTPERPKLSMKDIAEELGLPSSTTVRLVQTLESEGYIRKRDDGLYAPGARMMRIALSLSRCLNLPDVIRPHLERLRDQTRETVCFGQLASPDEVVYLEQCDSPLAVRHVRWVGQHVPVKGTVIGAVLSEGCPRGEFRSSRTTLEPDVTAIAMPVYGSDGKLVGAVNITGPTFRISDDDIPQIAGLLRAEVAKMEENL